MPIEVVEHGAPIVVWRKELRPDSGGAGEQRGGLGLTIEIGTRHDAPFSLLAMFERIHNASQGRADGGAGAPGRVHLRSGSALQGKGLQEVPAGDRLILETPGGAGYGDPRKRLPERVQADIRLGLVSASGAEKIAAPKR
jgi:N-methylhydantoinase B